MDDHSTQRTNIGSGTDIVTSAIFHGVIRLIYIHTLT